MQAIKCVVLGDGAVGKLSKINDFYVFQFFYFSEDTNLDRCCIYCCLMLFLKSITIFFVVVFGEPSSKIELSNLV